MKTYLVKVIAAIPYLWETYFEVEASNVPTAVRRAYQLARKETFLGKKRIKDWRFEVTVLEPLQKSR